MTINELIEELMLVPEEKRNLPIYVSERDTSDQYEVGSVSLYDYDSDHDKENMLGINY